MSGRGLMRCGLVVWPAPMCGWLRNVRVWSVNSINCEYNQPKKINKIIHYSYAMSQSQVVRQFEVAKMLFDFKTLAGNCQVNKKNVFQMNYIHTDGKPKIHPQHACRIHNPTPLPPPPCLPRCDFSGVEISFQTDRSWMWWQWGTNVIFFF